MTAPDTLLLRLAGPMQSWGTSSRFQLRRTDLYPSKSGVLGLILCAMGIRRADSPPVLARLAGLAMGVRIDRPGTVDWDYHTVGAKIGIRSATGRIKITQTTGEIETLLSRRQYLFDASFLVALHGKPDLIDQCVQALQDPVWPVFLGRKCCIPSEPVFLQSGNFTTLNAALLSVPWSPRIKSIDGGGQSGTRELETFVEHPPGTPAPPDARIVHDVPRAFGYFSHGPRLIVRRSVTVSIGGEMYKPISSSKWKDPYGPDWEVKRRTRLANDYHLCVFCKSPAQEVHHLDYEDVRLETLRSLCKDCHDACTMLEYGDGMSSRRIDPCDPMQRPALLSQLAKILNERRLTRRRDLLSTGRASAGYHASTGSSPVRKEAQDNVPFTALD